MPRRSVLGQHCVEHLTHMLAPTYTDPSGFSTQAQNSIFSWFISLFSSATGNSPDATADSEAKQPSLPKEKEQQRDATNADLRMNCAGSVDIGGCSRERQVRVALARLASLYDQCTGPGGGRACVEHNEFAKQLGLLKGPYLVTVMKDSAATVAEAEVFLVGGWALGGGGAAPTVVARSVEAESAAIKAQSARALASVLSRVALRRAGFSTEGIPIILDESASANGFANFLRSRGFNVRSVEEIWGATGIKDPVIKEFAEKIGAKVLSYDRGRAFGEGFAERVIQIPGKIKGKNFEDIVRIMSEQLK